MPSKQGTSTQRRKKGGKVLPALCNVAGTLLLVAVIALCVPLTVPMVMGYQVFDIVSGSMEPEIPVGSAVYVKGAEPAEIQEGDIIAFYENNSMVVHRVVVNRTSLGELVTKGDANEAEDFTPIPYKAVVGRVEASLPFVGAFMSIYASTAGKIYLLLTAACGVMLNILASRMRASRRPELEEAENDATETSTTSAAPAHAEGNTTRLANLPQIEAAPVTTGAVATEAPSATETSSPSDDTRTSKPRPKRRFSIVRWVLAGVLATAFLGSAGVIGFVTWQYNVSDATYGDATDRYTKNDGSIAPITVDFTSLRAQNPDIIGWIYCEGTPINYPVLRGKDNDQYLHHDYTGEYNINGSIFIDSANQANFSDSNTIVYGHHMNSGSMFASLVDWADQSFYEKHPIIWLLTPTQDYKVVLFSGHHTDAYSSMYEIIKQPGAQLNTFLATAIADSDFKPNPDVHVDYQARFVMLTTCAYLFDNDRYVLHGQLEPVSSAGGKAR